MQDEVNSKTVAFAVNSGKVTMRTLVKIARYLIQEEQRKRNLKKQSKAKIKNPKKKKMSVEKLSQKYDGLKSVEIDDTNIKGFERYAKKYNLEYALKKDGKDPPNYVVFFKGKDTDMITRAFKDLINDSAREKKPSLLKRLEVFTQKAMSLNKDKTKHKHQEQSL